MNRKPSLVKEAVRQVQKDQAQSQDSTRTPSPINDPNKNKEHTYTENDTLKKIPEEELPQDKQEELIGTTKNDMDGGNPKDVEAMQQEAQPNPKKDPSKNPERQERATINPYTKSNDPQVVARRVAARQRKKGSYQEVLEEIKKQAK